MKKHTGYGSLTLSFQKQTEGNNESDAMEKLVKTLNNYSLDLNDIKLVIKGKEIALNDFDVEWEDIQED